jgi:hypothetical protein
MNVKGLMGMSHIQPPGSQTRKRGGNGLRDLLQESVHVGTLSFLRRRLSYFLRLT